MTYKIFDTLQEYNDFTLNGTHLTAGTLYLVKENKSLYFSTNNIDGEAEKYEYLDEIPEGYIKPEGNIIITENGEEIDISTYATASVNVAPNLTTQNITENGTYEPSGDYDGFSSVTVNVAGSGDEVLRDLIERDITSINIPNGTTIIGGYAFSYCSRLTSINIPDSVTSIGPNAFYYCNSLPVENYIRYADTCAVEATDKTQTSYTLKEGTRFIVQGCFSNCNKMTEFTVPDSVVELGNDCLGYCNALTTITIGSGVTNFGVRISDGSSNVRTVIIKSNAIIEKNYNSNNGIGFLFNYTITSLDLQQTTPSSIGANAFYNCRALTSINIPDGVTRIGQGAFHYCRALTSINIPDSVTSIGYSAFYSCSSLTSVTIPDGVTSIGSSAFQECSGLTSVTVEATTPPTLATRAFDNTNNCPIYVPAESVDAYKTATNWSSYADRIQAIS